MMGYVLGIDLGTTTVKVALVDSSSREIVATKSRETQAAIPGDSVSSGNEQDPGKILTALQFCVSGLRKEDLTKVEHIGVSGQMHGVILWKSGQGWSRNALGRFDVDKASTLYTWQDGRCTPDFLSSLPEPRSHLRLASGFGCVTLLWLQQHSPETLKDFDCAGTIQDYVVSMLCDLKSPIISIQNAASWGYFDTEEKSWNVDRLAAIEFDVALLPTAVEPGTEAGWTQVPWYAIPADVPVDVAMGDLPCSIFSRLQHNSAVLNISTSAQLAFQMNEAFIPPTMDVTSTVEYFPYFHGRYLAVAASLGGGNVMASFVKMLQQWSHELGLGVPQAKIWEVIHNLAQDCGDTDLSVRPTLFGERHNPDLRAAVSNITPFNTSLGSVYRALCKGLVANLHSMMSQDFLLAAGVSKIIGSGTAVLKNCVLQKEIEAQYKLPLELCPGSEADSAVGAALATLDHMRLTAGVSC